MKSQKVIRDIIERTESESWKAPWKFSSLSADREAEIRKGNLCEVT